MRNENCVCIKYFNIFKVSIISINLSMYFSGGKWGSWHRFWGQKLMRMSELSPIPCKLRYLMKLFRLGDMYNSHWLSHQPINNILNQKHIIWWNNYKISATIHSNTLFIYGKNDMFTYFKYSSPHYSLLQLCLSSCISKTLKLWLYKEAVRNKFFQIFIRNLPSFFHIVPELLAGI